MLSELKNFLEEGIDAQMGLSFVVFGSLKGYNYKKFRETFEGIKHILKLNLSEKGVKEVMDFELSEEEFEIIYFRLYEQALDKMIEAISLKEELSKEND